MCVRFHCYWAPARAERSSYWPVHNLIVAGFSHALAGKGSLETAGMRDEPAAGLMLPLTVQLLVAMLAYGLNERMVRKAERNRERTCKQFLGSHREALYACDSFAVETPGIFGTGPKALSNAGRSEA